MKINESIVFLKILLIKKLIIPTKTYKQYDLHGTGTDPRQFEIVLWILDKILE